MHPAINVARVEGKGNAAHLSDLSENPQRGFAPELAATAAQVSTTAPSNAARLGRRRRAYIRGRADHLCATSQSRSCAGPTIHTSDLP